MTDEQCRRIIEKLEEIEVAIVRNGNRLDDILEAVKAVERAVERC